jgi:hypothetical protein
MDDAEAIDLDDAADAETPSPAPVPARTLTDLVHILAGKAADAGHHIEAFNFAQAAKELAIAHDVLDHVKGNEADRERAIASRARMDAEEAGKKADDETPAKPGGKAPKPPTT